MAIIDEVTGILHIKIKPRQDSYSDQFSRIFLLKVMFIGALFTGISWYSDKINCLIPKDQTDVSFVSSACWINGVYIYEEIRTHSNDVGYYGLPRTINTDGVDSHGALCSTELRGSNAMKKIPNPGCTPMKKTFFLQYQYMTFFLIALGSLYYAPYTIFKFVNSDLASLKSAIKGNLFIHSFICLFVCLFVCLFTCLFFYLFFNFCIFVFLIYLFIYFIYLLVYIFTCLFIYLFIYLHVYLFICITLFRVCQRAIP